MLMSWLKEKRRHKILEQPFPRQWGEYIVSNVAHWAFLDAAERDYLQDLVQVFVAEKTWEPCGVPHLTAEIQVTIAAQACLLLLGFDHDLYRNVKSILVYPSTVVAPDHVDPDTFHVLGVHRSAVPILGQAVAHGPVILVWDAVAMNARHPERGHNVVYHEFAHKIDMLDGTVDGTPPLADHAEFARWVVVCTREFELVRKKGAQGRRTLLGAYAGTNPAECFADATEVFFDKPTKMKETHPDLYDVLHLFYKQDPSAREQHF